MHDRQEELLGGQGRVIVCVFRLRSKYLGWGTLVRGAIAGRISRHMRKAALLPLEQGSVAWGRGRALSDFIR